MNLSPYLSYGRFDCDPKYWENDVEKFVIRFVKSVEVEVEAYNAEDAMNMVDSMDADGSLELVADYYQITDTGEEIHLN